MSKIGNIPWNKGLKTGALSIDHRKKISQANKGHIPWIKGKKHVAEAIKIMGDKSKEWHKNNKEIFRKKIIYTEERKKKLSEKMKGNKYALGSRHTEEWKEDASKRMKGGNSTSFKKGMKLSKETKQKIAESRKSYRQSDKTKQMISETRRRLISEGKITFKRNSGSFRKGMTPTMLGKHHSEEAKIKMRLARIGKHIHTKETKALISKTSKERWNNEEYKNRTIKTILKSLQARPTSLEQQMIDIIELNGLPYIYTGNGDLIIGGKCPDFANVNGEKTCIDVRNNNVSRIFHNTSPEEYEKQRIEHFAKYRWKCIVFNTDDKLNEKEVLEKLGLEF